MTSLDQLVFGYRDGHQLLGGSRQLDPRDLRLLLGATDMSIDHADGPFLTGLRLQTEPSYALCATWAAPEAPRPGAVWAHVILIPATLLGDLSHPMSIASGFVRPRLADLGSYGSKLLTPTDDRPGDEIASGILERVVSAAYGADDRSVLVESDLDSATLAIAAVWRTQWPALRLQFSFRTRSTARADRAGADVVVARRIRGTARPPKQTHAPWVRLICEAILSPAGSTFRSFLEEFGPLEPATMGSVRELAEVFGCLGEGSVDAVREAVERSYPTPGAGAALKVALFGPGSSRPWSGSESERIHSLLSTTSDAWDVESLHLASRVHQLMSEQGVSGVAESLSGATADVNDAVLEALVQRNMASDLRDVFKFQPDLAARLVHKRPSLLNSNEAWEGLPERAALHLLSVEAPGPRGLVAALRAGFGEEVLMATDPSVVASAVLRQGSYNDARSIFGSLGPAQLPSDPADDRLTFLRVSLWGSAEVDDTLPERLERCRSDADEFWLRSATEAIASSQLSRSEVLCVAFGPLHEAITADRLPRDCWDTLGPVLPEAGDPALRLRRYLLSAAQEEHWNTEQFERALRGAGPYAGQLLHEFGDDEDWWVAAARSALNAAMGLLGTRR